MMAKLCIGALLAYGMYAVFYFSIQRKLLFPGRQIEIPSAGTAPGFVQKIPLAVSFGSVESWFVPAADGSGEGRRPAVIFAHGNAEIIDYCLDELLPYRDLGIHLLLVEFPGYGRSEGEPSERTIAETMAAAYDRIAARDDVDAGRIFAHGRSVGGGAICRLAAQRPLRALVLQSTFTSVRSFAARYFLPPLLVRDPFDNLSVVRSFNGPVLVIHGRHDEIIPYKNGVRLASAAKNGKLLSYDCAHNDCPPDHGRYWNDISGFLASAGIRTEKDNRHQ
jgi:fermentation-respiration switch protein FrsA (DUF1100 family)